MLKKIGYGLLTLLVLLTGFIAYQWVRFNDQNFVADKGADWYQARLDTVWGDEPIPYFRDVAFSPDRIKWPFSILAEKSFHEIPTMLNYPLNDGAKKPAVMILPGGGYLIRAEKHEGIKVAEWLNSHGIAAFGVNYRLTPYDHPVPLLDAQRAMKQIRDRADEFNIDPERIGVLGFSAGGHLAAMASTRYTGPADKPAFAMLGYGVVAPVTGNQPMAESLYRKDGFAAVDRKAVSPELYINADTPPTFLWHTKDDPVVAVSQSQLYYDILQQHNVPAALHLFDNGTHGLSLAADTEGTNQWPGLFIEWLGAQGFLNDETP